MIDAKVGDLVRHITSKKYGIIISVVGQLGGRGVYFVVLWYGTSRLDWLWDDMVEKVTE